MKRGGFTLIELLVVISIIALLSSVVLASLNAARDKARLSGGKQFAGQVDRALGDEAVLVWDFDECTGTSTADRSGLGNHGTLTGTVSFSSTTPTGAGCSFASAGGYNNRYVESGKTLSLGSGKNVTMAGWFYANAAMSYTGLIGQINIAGSGMDFGVDLRASGAVAVWRNNDVLYQTTLTTPVQRWFHLALVYDGSTIRLYLDGQEAWRTNFTGTLTDLYTFKVGRDWDQAWNGYIDGVRVFKKGLTASEVGALYAAEAPRFQAAQAE